MSQQVQPFAILYFPPPPPNAPGAGYPGANRLSLVPVRDVMPQTTVEWINASDTCFEAARKMLDRNVGLLPVKDGEMNYLVGVITDRDIVTRVAAQRTDPAAALVSTAMTSPIIAMVYEDADLMAAERLMIERQVRRLLVLRRSDNVVLGVLSVDDLARNGQRRRAGEIIRGAAALAVEPSIGAKSLAAVGRAAGAQTGEEVHSSIFKVRDVMGGGVECVRESDTCTVAAEKMLNRSVGCLPVCSDMGAGNRIVGMITDRDLVVRAIAAGLPLASTKVGAVMSHNVACCYADDNLADAEKLMLERCIRRLPVLQRTDNSLVGLLSVDDIALSASRGRAGRVIEYAGARPNEVFGGTGIPTSTQKA